MPTFALRNMVLCLVISVGGLYGQNDTSECRVAVPPTDEQRSAANQLNTLGVNLSTAGDVQGALQVFTEATVKFPFDAVSWNNVGVILSVRLGQHEAAIPYFQRAVCLDPMFSYSHFSFGTALYHLRQFEPSEFHLKRAIEIDPLSTQAMNNLGSLYMRTKRHKAAVKLFQDLYARTPNDFYAANNLAAAIFYNREFKSAAKLFNDLRDRWPDRDILKFNHAVVLLKLGRRDDARGIYRLLQNSDVELAQQLLKGINERYVLSLREH